MMAGIRGRDSSPEIKTRRLLHRHGFRYRLKLNQNVKRDLRNRDELLNQGGE
jgi:G:T-mismatch repair DNA endonuclease (very short patch repair protein)